MLKGVRQQMCRNFFAVLCGFAALRQPYRSQTLFRVASGHKSGTKVLTA